MGPKTQGVICGRVMPETRKLSITPAQVHCAGPADLHAQGRAGAGCAEQVEQFAVNAVLSRLVERVRTPAAACAEAGEALTQ